MSRNDLALLKFDMGITPAAAYRRTSDLTMNDFSDGAVFCSHGTPTKNEDEDCYVDP